MIDDEGEIVRMLLFENQIPGLLNLMRDKDLWKDDTSFGAKEALEKYFVGFCDKPIESELQLLLDNTRNNEIMPTRYLLENRKQIEPLYVAEKAEQECLDLFELAGNVYDETEMVQDLYGSREEYIRKVCDARIFKGKSVMIGQKVEELPVECIPFDGTPVYDIDELVTEVKLEMFQGTYEGIGTVCWTDQAYKQFYGRYFLATHNIEINAVLNSKDVPREVVKYVIYHEMLHRDFPYHDREFRKLEHLYPKYEEWDHFLDDNMTRFDIKEW